MPLKSHKHAQSTPVRSAQLWQRQRPQYQIYIADHANKSIYVSPFHCRKRNNIPWPLQISLWCKQTWNAWEGRNIMVVAKNLRCWKRSVYMHGQLHTEQRNCSATHQYVDQSCASRWDPPTCHSHTTHELGRCITSICRWGLRFLKQMCNTCLFTVINARIWMLSTDLSANSFMQITMLQAFSEHMFLVDNVVV